MKTFVCTMLACFALAACGDPTPRESESEALVRQYGSSAQGCRDLEKMDSDAARQAFADADCQREIDRDAEDKLHRNMVVYDG